MAADEKWYFTKEQLANTPSRKHGYDADRELSSRQQAANLIQDMGQKLQVTQLCINTAIVYMHRFYMFHSFTRFHRNSMAAAALFLAAKVEEQPRKLEYVIKVAQICLHRDHPPVDIRSEAYLEQAQELVVNENILLQTLGFDVAIDHPHTHVVRCCHLVRASKELAQTSYFMASNSLHLTTMCLQYKPTEVACFCIHLACKWSNWEIPQSTEGKPWFWYVDKSVTQELLEQLTDEFLVMFEKCPSRLKKKIMSLSSTQNSTILSAFGNDGDKKRNGEGSSGSAISFGSSDDMKKKQEFQRHHPDFKKHPNMPHHSRPDAHGMQSKSSCMFGPPQRTQPPVHSGSSGGSTNQSRSMPVKPNAGQDPALAKRDHLHHKMRRPEEKHPTRNHEPIPPPYKKYDKVSSGSLSDFPQNSLNNNVRAVGTSSYMLPPSHQQLQPQAQPQPTQAHHPQPQQPLQILHPVMDVKPELTPHTINKHQIHPHAPNAAPPKPKTPPAPPPPVKVERSIFSPEKSTPPMETMTRIKVPSPTVLPSLTPGSDTSRKRSISREPELAIYSKTEDVKPTPPPPVVQVQEHIKTENLIKEEKPLDNKAYSPVETSLPVIEPLNSTPPQSTSAQEESHKEQKKKKKKHKEHKEHKDRHKDKHKHKHKNRDSVKADPIVITIPKEKLTLHQQQPEQILKLKIPKDRIAAASVPSPTGLKIKIPKDKIKESSKRDRSEDRNAGPPSKYHRPNGTTLQVNKTIDLMECSSNSDINENDTNSLNSSLSPLALNNLSSSFDDDLVHKTPPGMTEAVLELVKSFEAEKSKQTDKSESSNNNSNCTNTTPTNNNNRNNINNNRNKQNNNLVSNYNNQEIVADAYHFQNVNREKYNNRNYYRPEQMNYNKNNYRGRGRGRYIRNRGGYNMGPRPPHPNYPGNFVPPQMNIPPPTLGYNPIPLMHHPPMLSYFTSQVYVPNYPPPPPLPEEPPPPQPPPPPPPPD